MSEQINLQNTNSEQDEISLKELIIKIKEWVAYLKSKWKVILFISFIGAVIGVAYAFIEKPTYKATLTFALEEDKGGGGGGLSGALGLASSFGIDIGGSGGGAFAGSNLIELMKSRLLVEKTLLNPVVLNNETISIAEYYIRINKLRAVWDKKDALKNIQFLPNADRSTFSLQQDSILQTLFNSLTDKDNLSILQKDKKVSITSLQVNSEDEKFAKAFCENLAKETSEFYIETKSKKARMNLEVLQKQADSIRAVLNGAITGVAAAADNVFNLNPAFNVRQAPSKMKQVDVQANTAVLTQLIPQLEMSKVTLLKETPLIQVIDKPILPLEKVKTGKLKALLLGGFLAGFFTVLYLVFGQLYKKLVA
jgi:uncharacterized protein involved in exopolysaccharide biosynthesis